MTDDAAQALRERVKLKIEDRPSRSARDKNDKWTRNAAAEKENARLMPFIDALLASRQKLREALERISEQNDDAFRWSVEWGPINQGIHSERIRAIEYSACEKLKARIAELGAEHFTAIAKLEKAREFLQRIASGALNGRKLCEEIARQALEETK